MTAILTLTDIAQRYGAHWLFEGLSLHVARRERLCLVGRNASGKSTLLKIMAGLCEPERGQRWCAPGQATVYLPQQPDFSAFETVEAAILAGLAGDAQAAHRAHAAAAEVGLDPGASPATLSGGAIRRLALTRAFAAEPDLLLLDEPTNHLDLPAIAWLEARLAGYRGALVVISHDRRLLATASDGTLWLERGQLRRNPKGFADFARWSETVYAAEEQARSRAAQHLRAELHWLTHGVTARRKRNQGRMQKLAALRAEKRAQIARQGNIGLVLQAGQASGKLVIEAEGVSKAFAGRPIIENFSCRVLRGDRLGIIGANGAGKTTLVRLLTGALAPDAGVVRHGSKLDIAIIDQQRHALEDGQSVGDFLTGGGDYIEVHGAKQHVTGYLKNFLFTPDQARAPIVNLSGGERSRLLLAKTFARSANLVVLDEPTNDLDMETLDLLEDLLAAYDGTLIMISHDRDFLDRILTSVIALDGAGGWSEHAGGFTDWERETGGWRDIPQSGRAPSGKPRREAPARTGNAATKLSYREARALAALPQDIAHWQGEVARLEAALADADLYRRDERAFHALSEALASARARLVEKEEAWLMLEMKREALASGKTE
ncbi:MAG: ABC-F family ATP-binding cassette domain-containing protein [Pseudomonadota bacterium]